MILRVEYARSGSSSSQTPQEWAKGASENLPVASFIGSELSRLFFRLEAGG